MLVPDYSTHSTTTHPTTHLDVSDTGFIAVVAIVVLVMLMPFHLAHKYRRHILPVMLPLVMVCIILPSML